MHVFKFRGTSIHLSLNIYHFLADVLKLGAWQVEGGYVVCSFCILTAVELEDSALNLLPRIEKWHISLKAVNS